MSVFSRRWATRATLSLLESSGGMEEALHIKRTQIPCGHYTTLSALCFRVYQACHSTRLAGCWTTGNPEKNKNKKQNQTPKSRDQVTRTLEWTVWTGVPDCEHQRYPRVCWFQTALYSARRYLFKGRMEYAGQLPLPARDLERLRCQITAPWNWNYWLWSGQLRKSSENTSREANS